MKLPGSGSMNAVVHMPDGTPILFLYREPSSLELVLYEDDERSAESYVYKFDAYAEERQVLEYARSWYEVVFGREEPARYHVQLYRHEPSGIVQLSKLGWSRVVAVDPHDAAETAWPDCTFADYPDRTVWSEYFAPAPARPSYERVYYWGDDSDGHVLAEVSLEEDAEA